MLPPRRKRAVWGNRAFERDAMPLLKLRPIVTLGAAVAASLFVFSGPRAQINESGDLSIELIDPKVLRVCADPRNMPFSNQNGEGFENKLAELVAGKLGKSLAYTWYPQAPGFVRNTLGAYKCDVVMGYPQGSDVLQGTNPYYRTAYALVFRPGTGLDGIDTLADPRLKGKRIGIVAGTPPATHLAVNGLMTSAKPYPLVIDTRVDSSSQAMINDLGTGEIEVGVLWGPIAGYFAVKANPPLTVVPLVKDRSAPRLAYYISMGVRGADQEWKRLLNRLIAENQPAIDRLLASFGVPLLDDKDRPISVDSSATPRQ
jgi:quinoprotein dehydrogenase-associated probable ABC transporter substrate-binding protein